MIPKPFWDYSSFTITISAVIRLCNSSVEYISVQYISYLIGYIMKQSQSVQSGHRGSHNTGSPHSIQISGTSLFKYALGMFEGCEEAPYGWNFSSSLENWDYRSA